MISPRYHREIPQRYRLEAAQCAGCGKVWFPPRKICKACGGEEFKPTVLPTRGKVLTYTVIRIPPAQFEEQKPYTVAIVELENGVRLTCVVTESPPDEVKIGTRVELIFRRIQKESEWGVLQYGYKAKVLAE
jgi:uncharacterized OB-fold protein